MPKKSAKPTATNKSTKGEPHRTITLPMFPVMQGKHRMYAFVAQSDHLRRIVAFSRRVDDKENGFQRHFKDPRLRQIGRYIDQNGPIPNNIILDLNAEEVQIDEQNRTITLPSDKECGLVIDGQHRLLGFKYASTTYPLLVMAFAGLDEKEKVGVFVTINTEQKRLPTSLCLDLLNIIGQDSDVDTRCRDIVASLNEDEESPWYGQIDMTGESKSGLISLVNFVRKLKPLLTGAGFMKSMTVTDQTKILINYWKGVRAVFADQWGSSLLTKTLGFGALMNNLTDVFTKTQAMSKGHFNPPAVIETFKLIKDLQFDADTFGSGQGNKAEMRAAEIITEKLEGAMKANGGVKGKSVLMLD